jgi:hypothetical protein
MNVDLEKQWRIANARHLRGQRLKFQSYTCWSDTWDHDHRAPCGVKLTQSDEPDVQHAGYATCDDYRKGARYDWVCSTCFTDLKDDLQWISDSS